MISQDCCIVCWSDVINVIILKKFYSIFAGDMVLCLFRRISGCKYGCYEQSLSFLNMFIPNKKIYLFLLLNECFKTFHYKIIIMFDGFMNDDKILNDLKCIVRGSIISISYNFQFKIQNFMKKIDAMKHNLFYALPSTNKSK